MSAHSKLAHMVGDLGEVMPQTWAPCLPVPPPHVRGLPIFAVLGRDGYTAVGGQMLNEGGAGRLG